jgi:tetratricopeptide (TPR) repeat protein
MLKEATIAWRLGRYTQALRWLGRGLRALEGVEGDAAGAERARLCATTGLVRGRQSRRRQAIGWLERAIAEAQASGADDALALAYYLLDHQYEALGQLEDVANSERALAIYEELGDVERQGIVLNSLGVYAHEQGRWDESVEFYERARQAWEHSGNQFAASFAVTNRAEVLSDQGHFDEAEQLLRAALRVARASHSESRVADVSVYLGRLLARTGSFEEALELLGSAREQFAKSGDRGEALAIDAKIAECLVLAGKPEDALAGADASLATADATEGTSLLLPLLGRVRGCSLMRLGRADEARAVLEESLAAAREFKMDYEVGLMLCALLALPSEDADSVSVLEREREAIVARLGIVATPVLSLTGAATTR